MPNLDAALYKWIFQANEKRDDLGLPPGFIEESIALLKRVLGEECLEQLLIVESGPIPVMDDEAQSERIAGDFRVAGLQNVRVFKGGYFEDWVKAAVNESLQP